ncbi:MAG: M56 family metallopeptidase [Pedobacter sp.]|nr:MAG: M56 family metallopeptidase [Pedobacter sp.]
MDYFLYTFSKALGWSMFHSLWQSALLFICLMGLFAIFPSLKPRLKHNLSLSFQVLMLVAFVYNFYYFFDWKIFENQMLPNNIKYNVPGNLITDNYFKIPKEFSDKWFPIFSIIYLVGILIQIGWVFVGYKNSLNIRKKGLTPIPTSWQNTFEEALIKLNIKRKVQFYLSHKIDVPMVLGYLKPVVLFPISLVSNLSPIQMEAILLHELAHIKRNDYLFNLIKTCIETLLFFNPFVWITSFHIKIEREHACDDLVINSHITPFQYAEALLNLEIAKVENAQFALKVAENKYHLYQRIKRITQMKSTYQNSKQKLALLMISIISLISITFMEIQPTSAKVTNKSTKIINTESIQKPIVSKLNVDTPRKKSTPNKYIIVDKNGVKQTYGSFEELPDSLQKDFKLKMEQLDSVKVKLAKKMYDMHIDLENKNAILFKKYKGKPLNNPEELGIHVKKINERMKNLAIGIETKDWKEQHAKMAEHAKSLREKTKDLKIRIDGKVFNDDMAKLSGNTQEILRKLGTVNKEVNEQLAKSFKNYNFKFQDPNFQKDLSDFKKLMESEEYKELKKKFDADVEKLKKEKGLTSKS